MNRTICCRWLTGETSHARYVEVHTNIREIGLVMWHLNVAKSGSSVAYIAQLDLHGTAILFGILTLFTILIHDLSRNNSIKSLCGWEPLLMLSRIYWHSFNFFSITFYDTSSIASNNICEGIACIISLLKVEIILF